MPSSFLSTLYLQVLIWLGDNNRPMQLFVGLRHTCSGAYVVGPKVPPSKVGKCISSLVIKITVAGEPAVLA
jgi:hypothetical protein